DVESLGAQRVPGWTAGDRRAGEGVLVRLRIAPDDEARVGDGGAADVVPAAECRGERLAMVARVPIDVPAVEGIRARGRGRRVGGGGLDVDQRSAGGGFGGGGIDERVVTPEDVLGGRVFGEIAGVSRETQGALVHRVHRDVAARDVVAQIAAGAEVAEHGRRLAGERQLEVLDEDRRQLRRRQLTAATGEVDVLRLGALGADRVAGVLPGGGRLRKVAVDQDVAQIERLHVIARQIDVEVEDRGREVAPEDHVGQDRYGC